MAEKEKIITRLRRIEGQVRGLVRMVEKEEECEAILTQLLAVRAALDKAGLRVVSHYMQHCLPDDLTSEGMLQAREKLQRVMELLMRIQ